MHRSTSNNWSRRRLMAAVAFTPVAAAAALPARTSFAASATDGAAASAGAGHATATRISAETARQRLIDGNRRYVAGRHLRIDHSPRREATAPKQTPFAIILGCSDSRVPPEILFDQGLGDLFTIRGAGNIAGDLAIGSMEYAVEHFAVPLIVVLGHERCGAVT